MSIATAPHLDAIAQQLDGLGIDARRPDRVLIFNADELLESLLVKDQLDWSRFQERLGGPVGELRARCGGLRAFGEMVGLLWSRGRLTTALRLEEYWARAQATTPGSLFCAYPIDLLGRDYDASAINAILRTHTHLVPFGCAGRLAAALERSMDEVLGPGAARVRRLVKSYFRPSWAMVPEAEALVLWVRSNLPQYSAQILERARRYYEGPALALP